MGINPLYLSKHSMLTHEKKTPYNPYITVLSLRNVKSNGLEYD